MKEELQFVLVLHMCGARWSFPLEQQVLLLKNTVRRVAGMAQTWRKNKKFHLKQFSKFVKYLQWLCCFGFCSVFWTNRLSDFLQLTMHLHNAQQVKKKSRCAQQSEWAPNPTFSWSFKAWACLLLIKCQIFRLPGCENLKVEILIQSHQMFYT